MICANFNVSFLSFIGDTINLGNSCDWYIIYIYIYILCWIYILITVVDALVEK